MQIVSSQAFDSWSPTIYSLVHLPEKTKSLTSAPVPFPCSKDSLLLIYFFAVLLKVLQAVPGQLLTVQILREQKPGAAFFFIFLTYILYILCKYYWGAGYKNHIPDTEIQIMSRCFWNTDTGVLQWCVLLLSTMWLCSTSNGKGIMAFYRWHGLP